MRCRWSWLFAAGAFSMALEISGCATMIHGTTQKVLIETVPSGATARILPEETLITTPGTVELKRKQAHTVIVNRDGYCPEVLYLDRVTSNAIHGNLLFGGLIGISVDTSNGAAYKLTPDTITVTLRSAAAGAPSCTPSICK